MSYKAYKKTLIIIGLSYLPMFLLDILGSYFVPEANLPVINVLVYYAFRILSLFLLFFSIYAGVSGVTGTRKLEVPGIFITLGAFLVIASFGPPILFGYYGPNEKGKNNYIESKETDNQAQTNNSLIESKRQLDIAKANMRNTASVLVSILAIATIVFLIYIFYKFYKRQ